ncbi:MAG: hypothetical protein WBW88_03025, partial [Rhodothermales bacterium]
MYWKAWELAAANLHPPSPEAGFPSPFVDAAFNENIFLWDTAFITMFCNLAAPLLPGVESLDNFYAKQHESGEICREIVRATGRDLPEWTNTENQPLFSRIGWSGTWDDRPEHPIPIEYRGREAPSVNPSLTLDGLNHPILAWAEMESFRQTGNRDRLDRVFEPLTRYFGALDTYLRQGNGLYM